MPDYADFASQNEALKRRRAMLDAMMAQSQQAPLVGQQGWIQALAKVAAAGVGKYKGRELDQAQASNARGYSEGLADQTRGFMDQYFGSGGIKQMPATPEGEATMVSPGQAADPKAAIVQAMTSQYPEMQQLGKSYMGSLQKETMSPKDIMGIGGADLKSRIVAALTGDLSALAPERKTHVVNGQLVRENDNGAEVAGDFRDKFGPVGAVGNGPGGPITGQLNTSTGEAKFAPKGTTVTVHNSVPAGETEFAKVLGKGTAEEFIKARSEAETAYRTKGVVKQLQALERKGIFTGPTANYATTLGAWAQQLGIPVDGNKLSNSQAFQQQIQKQVADVLMAGGGVGRSMTNEDRKAFEQSLPQMLMTPQGRAQVYQMMLSSADQSIARHQSMQKALEGNPAYAGSQGMLTYNPADQAGAGPGALPPETPVVGQEPIMSVEEWLALKKQKKGR